MKEAIGRVWEAFLGIVSRGSLQCSIKEVGDTEEFKGGLPAPAVAPRTETCTPWVCIRGRLLFDLDVI